MGEPEMEIAGNVEIFIFLSCQDRKNLIQVIMSGLWKRLRFCSNWTMLTPASKVFCPLDFGVLGVLPHGQIVGFCGVFWTFDGCINVCSSTSK